MELSNHCREPSSFQAALPHMGSSSVTLRVSEHSPLPPAYNAKVIITNLPADFAQPGVSAVILACAGYSADHVLVVAEHLSSAGPCICSPCFDNIIAFCMVSAHAPGLQAIPCAFSVADCTVRVKVHFVPMHGGPSCKRQQPCPAPKQPIGQVAGGRPVPGPGLPIPATGAQPMYVDPC